MPRRNVYKTFIKNGCYHVYNRGVEKRKIFLDKQDYTVFLNNLKLYLLKNEPLQGTTLKGIQPRRKNYNEDITLISYCLMPNHFHFLLKQLNKHAMQNFMRSLTVKYSMYFNKKYNRVGQLFQGRYRAVLVTNDNYLLHLSRYIHLNPNEFTSNLIDVYSSYADFLGLKKTEWLKPDIILSYFNGRVAPEFKKISNYKNFVEKYKKEPSEILGRLTLDG